MKVVKDGPVEAANVYIENEAASFKYKWPSVVLIVNRAQWEIGRKS